MCVVSPTLAAPPGRTMRPVGTGQSPQRHRMMDDLPAPLWPQIRSVLPSSTLNVRSCRSFAPLGVRTETWSNWITRPSSRKTFAFSSFAWSLIIIRAPTSSCTRTLPASMYFRVKKVVVKVPQLLHVFQKDQWNLMQVPRAAEAYLDGACGSSGTSGSPRDPAIAIWSFAAMDAPIIHAIIAMNEGGPESWKKHFSMVSRVKTQ
mmetsp:Transcript_40047/g.113248  ORF Transcript_40047/g.113248 Transcript_40047/m.113248 type:complete len:204 (-) Transcript_40047:647-1258(-)